MDQREVEALARIMVKRHGKGAETIARKRAIRCRRMLEEKWATTWAAVADAIAQERRAAE